MDGYKFWIAAVCGMLLAGTGSTLALADVADVDAVNKAATEASLTVGYRATSEHGEPGRAREFDSLESSPLFRGRLFTDQSPFRLDLGLDYLNEDDYSAEAHVDSQGLLRLDLRSQRFFHNLDHIPYANGFSGDPAGVPANRAPGQAVEGNRPDATANNAYRAYYSDQNPDENYGLQLDFSEARLKIKCPDYPAHINLSYWRFEKEGDRQMRFVGENCTTACHMQSKSRDIDRVTEEVKAGVDAHVGFFDVVLEGLLRTFRDHESVPVDYFGAHTSPGLRAAGYYEHNEDPDSKLKELTLKLNTAPSGGFVASAAFTMGERENRSDLTSVAPVRATTDYYRASADATYTPSQHWTFNLRYRLLDLDSDNSNTLYNTAAASAFNSPLPVREAMDITRAWYEATASYRPVQQLSVKAELRREDIDRSNTGPGRSHSSSTTPITINPEWELPDEEIITKFKLGFTSRLLEKSALKLSGWLAIQQNDDPAYGSSYGDSQELFLASSYTPSPFWGIQANVNLLQQENNDLERQGFDIEREKDQQTVALGTWITPREGLSFDLNYGYFRTAIDQDLVFGTSAAYDFVDEGVDYRQTVQTLTLGMTWQALKDITCRLEGYHIRSKADYSPNFNEGPFDYNIFAPPAFRYSDLASSADLKGISELDIFQNGVRGRIDWQFDENLACGVEVTFDDYDERGNDVFDGSVQSYMASLTYTF